MSDMQSQETQPGLSLVLRIIAGPQFPPLKNKGILAVKDPALVSRSRNPWEGGVLCQSFTTVCAPSLVLGRFFEHCSVMSHLCGLHSIGEDTLMESPSQAHTKLCPTPRPSLSHGPQAWVTSDLFQTLWFCLVSHFILPRCTEWCFLCQLPSLFPEGCAC